MQHLFVSRALSPIFLPKSRIPSMAHLPTSAVTTAAVPGSKARLRGVVFDMDGTLTVPVIDFAAMYRAVLGEDEYRRIKAENPSGIDILHHIESWSPSKQHKAYEVIADYERQGLDRLQIMPGAADLCGFLDANKMRKSNRTWRDEKFSYLLAFPKVAILIRIPSLLFHLIRGLITRNVKEAVDIFHSRFGVIFSPALSREFRPYKPDPAPLLHICSAWEVKPNEVMMVGDSLKDDVACGKRAGAFTCLLDETGRYESPEFANVEYKPDFKVSSLSELHALMKTNFDLVP